ncbi:Serralysin [Methylobacterium bullatum]|uniref:Serralysin n=1 Tax=Methylobacterium bullatum TaxID=570505 RepID=A0A679J6Q7_9HYPH|nr:Serralysin [Methylobacterium bullatum]
MTSISMGDDEGRPGNTHDATSHGSFFFWPTASTPPIEQPIVFLHSVEEGTAQTGTLLSSALEAPDPDAAPTIHKTTDQAGVQITRDGYNWGTSFGAPVTISFGFRTSAPGYTVGGRDVQGTFSTFTEAQKVAARAALQLWSDVAGITFTDLGNSNNATIEFGNYSSTNDGSQAFAFLPINNDQSAGGYEGDVFINTSNASTTNISPGTYDYKTFIHEIGHAIGLNHPGNYNAGPGQNITYDNNAEYIEDTRQYSLMSYFSETYSGANFSGYSESPMLHDIAAVQRLYGANMSTRVDATVYGFNSNAGSPFLITSSGQSVAWAIWDAGGNDTIDASGYFQDAAISLVANEFSSIGGSVGNVAIAQGVTIENAIGGSGDDTINGNSVSNILTGNDGADRLTGFDGNDSLYGGDGDDILDGGSGADYLDGGTGTNTADFSTVTGGTGVMVNLAAQTALGSDGAQDTIRNIQNVLGSGLADTFYGDGADNLFVGGRGSDYVDGYLGDDTLIGGDDTDSEFEIDTVSYYRDLGVTVDLSVNTAQDTGGSGVDTLSGFEDLYGSYFNDTLVGDGNANFIYGAGGSDVIRGGAGNDTLQAGDPWAYIVKTAGQDNGTMATAVNVDAVFTTAYNGNIADSTVTPHATILARASGGGEYYSFTATSDATARFDIDQTLLGTDTVIKLFDADGVLLATADDGSEIDVGSQSLLDSTLEYTFALAGTYYVQVLSFPTNPSTPLKVETQYTLNVSLSGATVGREALGSTIEGGEGDDMIIGSSAGIDTLSYASATSGIFVSLNGSMAQDTEGAGTDTIFNMDNILGSAFSDQLTGNSAANVLDGAGGIDFLSGRGGNDSYVIDTAGDVVFEAVNGGTDTVRTTASYALHIGQEIETLRTTLDTGVTALNLTGNDLNNKIVGNDGANLLDGGAGIDTLYGRRGNDVFLVGTARDQVFETAGSGNDTVKAAVNYVLAARQSIETLRTQDDDGITSVRLTGNELDNKLVGNDGANVLDGGVGLDTLYGRDGNDIFLVGQAGDRVFEGVGNGTDTVKAAVSYGLAVGQEVEILRTQDDDSTTAIRLTGNEFNNKIVGNDGANVLEGARGSDTLYGGDGADTFLYRTLIDSTVAIANRDTLADFSTPQGDRIDLHLIDAVAGGVVNQAFTFIGSQAFHNKAGELQALSSSGKTVISGDVDGDGSADFSILLNSLVTLQKSDFIL